MGTISTQSFREQQKSEELLEILGYEQHPKENINQNLNRNPEFQLVDK